MTRQLYLHGFASGPFSRKAVYLKERLRAEHRIELDIPDLNVPSFEHLSITAMLEEARRHVLERERMVLWGSSLGGYLATYLASTMPERIERLILMAPAFEFPESFPRRAKESAPAWERGEAVSIYHHGAKRELPFYGDLYRDCANYPISPGVKCPTLVVAASRDEVIPLESIRRWLERHPSARLEFVDSPHEMTEDVETLAEHSFRFLGLER